MLNGRLYRAALVPFLLALGIAAFSLQARPRPMGTTLAPDAFDGSRAYAELARLAARYPDRAPGSTGDERLAEYVAGAVRSLGGTARGGFSVRTRTVHAQTIDGEQELETVIAERPGSTEASPILIVAHRDAAARGSAAELSGTAALLELARVFAARETKRTIVLASTSGGSGGDAGAAALPAAVHGPIDAAIVLGDVAGSKARRPLVIPYSDGLGAAPLALQRTVSDAITQQTGSDPGAPSALGQLAHLAFPLAAGEQGVLNAAGVPAVLVQVSGERGPAPHERVSAERLEGLGRGVLNAIDALDASPDVSPALETGIQLQHQVLPEWAVRLLVATLLLAPALTAIDGLARARRRRRPVGRSMLWALSCSLPFFSCGLFAYLIGGIRIVAAPPAPVLPGAMPFGAGAAGALVAVTLALALAWLLWVMMVRRVGWGVRPDPDAAGLTVLLVLIGVAGLAWVGNPFSALLMVPACHLWLILAAPELRPRRAGALALVALGLLPLALLLAFYARQLALGPLDVSWSAVLLVAGGHVGLLTAALWSLGLGCGAGAAILAASSPPPAAPHPAAPVEITIRGPIGYAGPGSLGGTESALRR
jgi:Peptidase family M28